MLLNEGINVRVKKDLTDYEVQLTHFTKHPMSLVASVAPVSSQSGLTVNVTAQGHRVSFWQDQE